MNPIPDHFTFFTEILQMVRHLAFKTVFLVFVAGYGENASERRIPHMVKGAVRRAPGPDG